MNKNKTAADASRQNGRLGGRPRKKKEEKKIKLQVYLLPDIFDFIKENGGDIVDKAIRKLKEFRAIKK